MRLLTPIIISVALTGCSLLHKQLPVPDKSVPDKFIYGLQATQPPQKSQSWLAALHDPLLADLIAKAERQNLGLAELKARLVEAEATQTIDTSTLLPRLDGQASADINHRLGRKETNINPSTTQQGRTSGTYTLAAKASWEVPLFGRYQSVVDGAKANVALAEEDIKAAQLILRAEIASAYIQLRTAQQRQQLIKWITDIQDQLVKLTKVRLINELASAFDLARAEQSATQTKAQLPQTLEDEALAKLRLMALLGQTTMDARLDKPDNLPAPSTVNINITPANLLRLRPDVRRAEAAVLRQSAELGVAKADVFPRLTLEGSIALNANLVGVSLVPGAGGVGNFGPSLTVPLFDWGQRFAKVDARYAGLVAETARYRQTVINAYEEAEASLNALAQQQARLALAANSATQAEQAAKLANVQQREGLIDLLEQLLVQERLLSAKQEKLDAAQSALNAYIQLHRVFAAGETLYNV